MIQIQANPKFVSSTSELPTYARPGDAGMDLRADLQLPLTIPGGRAVRIPTGLYMALPDVPSDSHRYAALITPRSGLASQGITVANTPGLIDSQYRGEVMVLLLNSTPDEYHVNPGDKIAQMLVIKVEVVEWQLVDQLPDSERGTGGFGHTGK